MARSFSQFLTIEWYCAEECGARSVYVGPDPKLNASVDSEAESTDDGENSILQDVGRSQKRMRLPLDAMDPQQTYRSLCSILECVHILDRVHESYVENGENK